MGARRQARILAFQALYAWETTGGSVEEACTFTWLDEEMADEEAASFARLLVAGALENIDSIDEAISSQLEHWTISRINRVDLAILRLSAYGLLYLKDIPGSITIDEAITLAKRYGTRDSYRFVNGVLDGILKRKAG
ncbi:MAG: transcription antitermination factor NusB [Spirochaetaceae bacterium]